MISKPSRILDDIVAAYDLERDLLKIAQRAVGKSELPLLKGTGFVGRPVTDSQGDIARLRSQLEEMTVAALWIEFERYFIQDLTSRAEIRSSTTPPFDAKFAAHIDHQIEFSRFDELIDLYKGWVDWDWISHRNPKRPRPAIIDPASARQIPGSVMDEVG
jgi:hypothetical protein